jgi:hypothetical protein
MNRAMKTASSSNAYSLTRREFLRTSTGQSITWEQAMESTADLSPERYDWDAQPPASEVALPGVTKFI